MARWRNNGSIPERERKANIVLRKTSNLVNKVRMGAKWKQVNVRDYKEVSINQFQGDIRVFSTDQYFMRYLGNFNLEFRYCIII